MNTVCWHMARRVRTGRCVSLYRCTRALGHDGEHRHVVHTRCLKHGPACPTYPTSKESDLSGKEIRKRDDVSHYTTGEIETIDFIADKFDGIEFCLANIVKYASRAKHKGQLRSDLDKIRNYAVIATELLDRQEEPR